MKNIDKSEQQMIKYVYIKGYSLKKYSGLEWIFYSATICNNANILKKPKKAINIP